MKFQTVIAIALIVWSQLCLSACSKAGQQEPVVAAQQDAETIEEQQGRILRNYAELEQKFLALREFEKENNPARSRLLRRAWELSQEQGTTEEMKRIVALMATGELRDAETRQKDVLKDMRRLLGLLQSEDRGKRIQDELQRNQEHLKEVERLIRMQKSLRAAAEGAGESDRLSKSQRQAADRAKKLAEKIGNGQADEPGQDLQGQGGEGGGGKSDPEETNPVRSRIAAAEQRMRQAKDSLDKAQREDSLEAMDAAILKLEQARKELEEILRQLREEEVGRTLAMLEGRFRKMMEREIRVRDDTKKLNAMVPEQRLADFEIKAGKLSAEQSSIAGEASRALLLLREDGTSVAFPQTVEEMKLDMEQVASRLSASKVGGITIEIENDIVETLGQLVEALAKARQENDENPGRSQGPPAGSPGESSLVGKIAELRMLRALQDRIFRRHTRYARLLDDPADPIGQTDDPEIVAALNRLKVRQNQLTEITKEIVESMEP